jgi:cytochrome c5
LLNSRCDRVAGACGVVDNPSSTHRRLEIKQAAFLALAAFLLLPLGSGAMAADGKANYNKYCAGCHKRISNKSFKGEGVAKLTASAIAGVKGKMPPRGGSKLSDGEIKAAVEYLITQ